MMFIYQFFLINYVASDNIVYAPSTLYFMMLPMYLVLKFMLAKVHDMWCVN